MKNVDIVRSEAIELMKNGIIKAETKKFTDKNGKTHTVKVPEEIKTFDEWKRAGRMVKKGAVHVAEFAIWVPTKKTQKLLDENDGKLEENQITRISMKMKKAYWFTKEQTQPIEEAEKEYKARAEERAKAKKTTKSKTTKKSTTAKKATAKTEPKKSEAKTTKKTATKTATKKAETKPTTKKTTAKKTATTKKTVTKKSTTAKKATGKASTKSKSKVTSTKTTAKRKAAAKTTAPKEVLVVDSTGAVIGVEVGENYSFL